MTIGPTLRSTDSYLVLSKVMADAMVYGMEKEVIVW